MAEGAQEVDILVVGSGLAGLTAALRFLDNARADASGHKPKVVILESDTVVGGRTRSTRLQDLPENSPLVSYGGTWVILDNQDLISLSQEVDWLPFQPKLLPNYSKGALNLGFFFAPYLLIKLWLIGKQIFQAPPDHPAYPELDATPLSVWVDQNKGSAFEPDKAAQAVIDWFFQVENYPSDIALLSTYFAAKSVFVRLSKITDTGLLVPKIMRWQDGTGAITHRMLEKIQSFGGSISFSRQVQSIAHDEHGATVSARVLGEETERVETFRAKYVVVATAVTNAANLTYTPELPEQSRGIIPSLQDWDDPSLQIIFAFKTQWWLSENQGASIYPAPIPDDQKGVYGPVFDLSETGPRTKGKKTKNGILRIICKTSRCTHADGTRWSDDEIQASAFQYLARFHQKRHETEEQTIARISKGLIQRWFFDFHQTPDINAVTFFIRPTEQSIYANNVRYLQDNYGRLYFAGSERATRGFNWMEGAVLSGRTTALQLLQAYYGESWTQANTDAYHAQLRQWLHEGLRRMKLEDVWDIPKYVATMWEIAWDSIAHFFDHLFHHEKPEMLHATLNGAKANFREPKNEAEAEILAELHAALENMPTESDMCLLDCQ